ncbi:ABC-type phosphate transport system, periplasmic component [Thiorhodococcus drewsii AZ1]|uniref:ABC-type phosphate transport system, periplasmic component n=1 Tax=Thiorhodococcus drewsii AZ1 TaxID=765913 RepID=G2E5R3_9GAMM|nr:hypothetical protein [Thiorhodococcus drewsii]EGV28558.1 ABC-type phosphate transport system, periplasmic component [Thiorhodococcus drewsii AZ1]
MRRLMLAFGLLFASIALAQVELAVIVNSESRLDGISDAELSRIFLSKTKRLPTGEVAHPVELSSGPDKVGFYRKVSGKKDIELRKYWATMIFTGNGHPPKQFRSAEDLLHYVTANPGAIAYLPRDAVDDSVKVLRIIK